MYEPRRPLAPYVLGKLRLDMMDAIRATWSGINMGNKIWVELKDGWQGMDGEREGRKGKREGKCK